MEEKEKMKILTQEEFDKEIVRALENDKVFIEFMNLTENMIQKEKLK